MRSSFHARVKLGGGGGGDYEYGNEPSSSKHDDEFLA
jgi:hypothetical protein